MLRVLIFSLIACGGDTPSGMPDPREEVAGRLEGRRSTGNGKELLRADNAPAACDAFAQAIRNRGGEGEWRGLVTASARAPQCLSDADGDAICAWAKGKANWLDPCAEWDAARGRPVEVRGLGPAARFRVAMRAGDRAAILAAAEASLLENATEVAACRFLVADALARNALREAEALPPCGTPPTSLRPRAAVLDRGGRFAAAASAFAEADDPIRAAAVLYQSLGDAQSDERARSLLTGAEPPVALHRAWFAILRGLPPPLDGLDGSPDATLVRALSGDADAVARLIDLPGPQAWVLSARLTGDFSGLDKALAAEPNAEPVLRANVGVRVAAGKDASRAISAWVGSDADHVRLRGGAVNRDQPWAALVPWSWADLRARVAIPEPSGADDVGDAYRAAMVLSGTPRADALAVLQAAHPELDGLAAERYAAQP